MTIDQKLKTVLLVNFGGPRDLEEIYRFLRELLTDGDVIRTPFPKKIQDLFFTRVAKKRAKRIEHDYELIGGKSPIYEDTEWLADVLKQNLSLPVLTFHRYLTDTHQDFLTSMKEFSSNEIIVFPLFPQFSYATTGSIARWFENHLSMQQIHQLRWIKSYSSHPAFISSYVKCIKEFMEEKKILEEETVLFFSPHGLPKSFIDEGDIYQKECQQSFQEIKKAFPRCLAEMGYQSQFGREEWLRPYTSELCASASSWAKSYKNVVFIPLSFTSDHIETLFEVEYQYLPLVQQAGMHAYRCPALNRRDDWIEAIEKIVEEADFVSNQMLIRR